MSEVKKNPLDAILKQYENSNSPRGASQEKKYDLANYFNTALKDGVKSGTKKVRILPTSDGSSPFVVMYGHKAVIDGERKTLPCLKHEKGEQCPFCEARELLLETGKESDKELAKKYNSRKMYVVKVIDRDNEQDGVKFWRFNHDFRKEGVYDKIYSVLLALQKDVTDVNTGRDLVITINRNANGAPVVSGIQAIDPTPLSSNPELVTKWTTDTRTWADVYSIRNYDYMKLVVNGKTPMWDKEKKQFVDKDSATNNTEAEVTIGVENVKSNIKAATVPTSAVAEPVTNNEGDTDDLPF